MTLLICRVSSSRPSPKLFTPALLLMTVMFFVPLRRTASMRFSGMPQRPKPPTMIVEPSGRSAMAASALGKTLFTASSGTLGHARGQRRLLKFVERPHVAHVRPQRVTLELQDLFQMSEIVERPFVNHLAGGYFADGLVMSLALQLRRTQGAQPLDVRPPLPREAFETPLRVLAIVMQFKGALFLIEEREHRFILLDHGRHARPHPELFDIIQVRQNLLQRPLAGRGCGPHLARREGGNLT